MRRRSSSTPRRSRRSATPSPTAPSSRSRTSRAGPAMRSAPRSPAVPEDATEILVLSGDVPLDHRRGSRAILDARREDDAAIALATVFAADPARLGSRRPQRVRDGRGDRRGQGRDRGGARQQRDQRRPVRLRCRLAAPPDRLAASRRPRTGELYLTELVRLAREDGRLVSAVAFEDDGRFDGINDRSQLAAAEWSLRVRRNEQHMRDGVTMRDPSTVYLDWDVTLAPDVTIEPNVILRGATSVGEGSVIGAGSQIVDSTIGRNTRVWASIVESSTVEDEATVGPYSHLRPGSVVGRGAEVGNYAELKNAHLGPGSKQHHMSYLGDAEIGARRSTSAPAPITANYDGTRKTRTTIGDGAFIGVDTMIVAPREIGDGREDRRRRGRHEGRAQRASWRSACRPGSASHAPTHGRRSTPVDAAEVDAASDADRRNPQPVTAPRERPGLRDRADRRPGPAQRDLLGHRDRARHAPAQPDPAAHRRGPTRRRPRPAPQGEPGPVPGGHPDRHQLPRLPRLGVRGGQPRRRRRGRVPPVRPARERGRGHRARRRHDPADAVHDRVRRARAQADRPRARRARGDRRRRG